MIGLLATTILTMSVSIYVPRYGGINGGAITASGEPVRTGISACGPSFPFGTVFELVEKDKALELSIPDTTVCKDRGGGISDRGLDIALVSEDIAGDLLRAGEWGRRLVQVIVNPIHRTPDKTWLAS